MFLLAITNSTDGNYHPSLIMRRSRISKCLRPPTQFHTKINQNRHSLERKQMVDMSEAAS